ncbi:MAG: type II secretion system protein [Candidatus Saccharibacteria bacterium]
MAHQKDNTRSQSGFTIVELLIVIVVIGILAAITIVAYGGITSRANTAKAQTNGQAIQSVAEAYNADANSGGAGYPATQAVLITYGALSTAVAKIPTSITWGTPAITSATTQAYVQYVPGLTASGANGGCIWWWNYSNNVINYTGVGNAVVNATSTTCSAA